MKKKILALLLTGVFPYSPAAAEATAALPPVRAAVPQMMLQPQRTAAPEAQREILRY